MEQGVFLDQPARKKGTHPASSEEALAVIDASSTVVIGNHADSAALQIAAAPYPLTSLESQISKSQELSIRVLDIIGSAVGSIIWATTASSFLEGWITPQCQRCPLVL